MGVGRGAPPSFLAHLGHLADEEVSSVMLPPAPLPRAMVGISEASDDVRYR